MSIPMEEDLVVETTPPPPPPPPPPLPQPKKSRSETIQNQIEAMQHSIETALRKIIESQSTLKTEVSTLSKNLTSKRRTNAIGESKAAKKSKQTCAKCQGEHPDLRCRQIPAEERIAMAVKRGICINCNSSHKGHCNREPACKKCDKSHLTTYHIEN